MSPLSRFSLCAFALLLTAMLWGSLWPPHDIHAIDLAQRHASPGSLFWLGSDHLGRDLFSRVALGGWNAWLVMLIAALIAAPGGSALGLLTAIAPPALQRLLLRGIEFSLVLPQLVLALIVIAAFGFSTLSVGLALGIGGLGHYASMSHTLAQGVLREQFISAARLDACSAPRVVWRHVWPHLQQPLRTWFAADAGQSLVQYAALAFLGLGADSGQPDWGSMLFEYRLYLFDNPALLLWPALAISISVLALHALAEPAARVPRARRHRVWPLTRLQTA